MTYVNTNDWWLTVRKRDVRTSFIIALFIHVFLFFLGGTIFFKTAQYSVQSVNETAEVDLVDTIEHPPAEVVQIHQPVDPEVKAKVAEANQPVQKKQEVLAKVQQTVNQGVKAEASPRGNSNGSVRGSPNYFQNPPPSYPELAKQMRQEGLVILAVDVDSEGMPIKVEINKSSGYRLLDQAALKAVSHWKFQPGRIGDLPIESKVMVPVRFYLQQ